MHFHQPPFRLKEIKLEVTHRCLLACIHCSSDANRYISAEMSREKCLKILNESIEMGIEKIVFSGGEPLLWPYIEESIGYVSKSIPEIVIYSSGNVPNIEDRLKVIAHLGITKIIFSIFSHDKNEHDRITRVSGSFLNTNNAIISAIKNKINTELHFVPLSNNFTSLTEIAKLGEKWGISRISILRFVPQGRGVLLKNRVLNRSQHIQLKKSIELLRKRGLDIRTGSPYNILMLNDQPACSSGIDKLLVGPDLRIYPCDAFKNIKAEELIGSLDFSTLEKRGLRECWEFSPFLSAIRIYLTSDFCEPCISCTGLEKCLSGCLAQKVIYNGDLRKSPDPLCMMA